MVSLRHQGNSRRPPARPFLVRIPSRTAPCRSSGAARQATGHRERSQVPQPAVPADDVPPGTKLADRRSPPGTSRTRIPSTQRDMCPKINTLISTSAGSTQKIKVKLKNCFQTTPELFLLCLLKHQSCSHFEIRRRDKHF